MLLPRKLTWKLRREPDRKRKELRPKRLLVKREKLRKNWRLSAWLKSKSVKDWLLWKLKRLLD